MRERVVAAREIAFGPLDLDHARAGIGEPAGAGRRRDRLFQRDDEQAFEGEEASFLHVIPAERSEGRNP